nr:DUF4838 domain-containing protein [Clostridia bacterium]
FYGQWIFCSRNQELIEVISKNIISWISQNPAVDMIAFWPQDGRDEQCRCPECQKYSKVANYTYFLNEVAKRVSAVHPHVKIDMLVYVDLWEPDENQTLEPCLMVDEATWADSGLRKAGASDGGGIVGTFFEDNLLKWHKLGAEVVYYDYYMGVYGARQRVIPLADEIQPMAKANREKGIMGSGTQIECFNMWNNLFNFYCFGRTQYDDSLGIDENFDRFGRIFGGGAKYLREIMHMTESTLEGQANIQEGGMYMMKNIDKEKVYSLYEKALEAADSPVYRNNIKMHRMAFRYSDVETAEAMTQTGVKYSALRKYEDKTGELYFLSKFDSFMHNDPGYAIAIPVDVAASDTFVPDKWYEFEAL